jgi:hypothetical protein
MRFPRSFVLLVLIFAGLIGAGCGEPPDSEVQQAQGAIDAARAAGAEVYAREEFAAATEALAQAKQAVDLRDYRLALSLALDSRERAQNAAKLAADGQAAARVEADRALTSLTAAVASLRTKLEAAEAGRLAARTLAPPRRALSDAEDRLQEAREAIDRGDYSKAVSVVSETLPSLTSAAESLDSAAAAATKRRAT